MSEVARKALDLSVVLCTHNPCPDYLRRVLEALRQQTLPHPCWELIVVDNASAEPLGQHLDLSWHPHSSLAREEHLGLTRARLCGISRASGRILVWVDDDTVLAPGYLEVALRLAQQHGLLGVWSGRVNLEFEAPPPAWTRQYWPFLVHRPITQDAISGSLKLEEPLPVGAGLCIRREIADAYRADAMHSALRLSLDRCGADQTSGGDTDMVLTACAMGWKRGVFASLSVQHLIPQHRLTMDHLASLAEGIQFSSHILEILYHLQPGPPPTGFWWQCRYYCALATKFGRKRKFFRATKRAQRRARHVFESLNGGARPVPT